MLTLTDCSLGTSPLHASARAYLLTALCTGDHYPRFRGNGGVKTVHLT